MTDTPQGANPQLDDLAAAQKAAQSLGLVVTRANATTPTSEALALVTENLAREYRVLPLAVNATTKQFSLGIADPSLLSKPAPSFLQALKAQGYQLTLSIVPATDFDQAVSAYAAHGAQATSPAPAVSTTNETKAPELVAETQQTPSISAPTQAPAQPKALSEQPAPSARATQPISQPAGQSPATAPSTDEAAIPATVHSAQVPTISLKDKVIAKAVLERFPADVARKYQMVVFAVSEDGKQASVAAVKPDDRRVREILKFVQERNGIAISLFQTSADDVRLALAGYGSSTDAPKTDTTQAEPQRPVRPTLDPLPTSQSSSRQAIDLTPKQSVVAPPSPVTTLPAPTPSITLERATTDKVKAVAKQAIPAMPPPPPVIPSTPLPASQLPGAPTAPSPKVGRVTPAIYQQAPSVPTPPAAPKIQSLALDQADLKTPSLPTPAMAPVQATPLASDDERNLDAMLGGAVTEVGQLQEVVKSGMIPRIIAAMLALAVSMKASDVHIESSRSTVRFRFRVDGDLQEILKVPTGLLAPLVSRIKILAKLKIDESRMPQDGRFDVQVAGHEIDLRVSTLPTVFGEKVVMRILDKSTGILSFEDLGIRGTNLLRIQDVIGDPYGIVLVTGPTGSGKTSTLYTILSQINTPDVNIVTLEDPVEYQLEGINQTQVRPNIGFTFADGLRSILRQDPNIIMVGEIRDKETAALATQAALTGHLVLSTLHTNTAAGAIPRMLDMGVEPFLLASSLKAIIGQRLVRRLVDQGRSPKQLTPEQVAEVKAELAVGMSPEVMKAASEQLAFSAPSDEASGYKGRVGLYEVLRMSDAMAQHTLKKDADTAIAKTAIAEGMVTMRQDGILKASEGLTSLEEVLQATAVQ